MRAGSVVPPRHPFRLRAHHSRSCGPSPWQQAAVLELPFRIPAAEVLYLVHCLAVPENCHDQLCELPTFNGRTWYTALFNSSAACVLNDDVTDPTEMPEQIPLQDMLNSSFAELPLDGYRP
jgi:hypothetical protein